ncbi:MAG: sigma-54 dependent transcriptional regulator [Desulfobacteraceae bacterium]|jgi:DNA-binding NtrC family response regulator
MLRILVIDDEQIIAKSCERSLTEEGYDVRIAFSGNDGMNMIKSESFDLVITDIKMPGISGMDILEYIKENRPEILVILVTGYSTIEDAVRSIKMGAFDYIPKPFNPDELVSVVREASIKKMQTLEKIYRLDNLPHKFGFDNIIGSSEPMQNLYSMIQKVADTDSTVLITGESGTGKELIARAIYNHSLRKDKQFITVDCNTLSSSILESELFGHKKGSFTGAASDKRGLFEIADKGTIFLDEVSNIPPEIQSKLLRILEQHEFRQVGSERLRKVDIRLIAATNRNLKLMFENGSFREDLYFRLNVFSITVPPLRERPEDIPILAYHFLSRVCQTLNKRIKGFSKEAMAIFLEYEWPGNVRELKNTVERIVLMHDNEKLSSRIVSQLIENDSAKNQINIPHTNGDLKEAKKEARDNAVKELEKKFLLEALARNEWNVTKAAEQTGIQRPNFQAMMKKYNITARDFSLKEVLLKDV